MSHIVGDHRGGRVRLGPRGQKPGAITSPLQPVLLARQPILDRRQTICGYELLYRPVPDQARPASGEAATASVIMAALTEIGLERLVGAAPAYINVTRDFVLELGDLPLPSDRVVLELVEDQVVDERLIDALRQLRGAGFVIALDDFVMAPDREPLLDLARIVKLDVRALDSVTLRDHTRELLARGLTLIAEKVETRAEYELCRELGFHCFQGYYFAEPVPIHGRRPPNHALGMLGALIDSGADWTFERLEAAIRQDAGLSHRFLRLVNSAAFYARAPVGSIREALVRLGTVPVRRWLMLLILAGLSDQPQHLLATALQRARLCELVASNDAAMEPDRAFTAGLLSVLDALLGQPMDEIVRELRLDERLSAALLDRAGPEGELLLAVLAYERGDFDDPALHGIDPAGIAEAYISSLGFSDEASALCSAGGAVAA